MEQDSLELKHLLDPQVGDYWHDRFKPVWVVIKVDEHTVTVCAKRVQDKEGGSRFDYNELQVHSREEFKAHMCYSSISIQDRSWATVVPGKLQYVVERIVPKVVPEWETEREPVKRYLVLGWYVDEGGGADDYIGSFDTVAEALNFLRKFVKDPTRTEGYHYHTIVDGMYFTEVASFGAFWEREPGWDSELYEGHEIDKLTKLGLIDGATKDQALLKGSA